MQRVDDLIEEKIVDLLSALDETEPGTEEHTAIVNDIARLQKQLSEDYSMLAAIEQRDGEAEDNRNKVEAETVLAAQEAGERKKEFWIKLAFDGLVTFAGMVFYKCLSNDTFKFEERGTISSGQGRRILQNIKMPKIGKF